MVVEVFDASLLVVETNAPVASTDPRMLEAFEAEQPASQQLVVPSNTQSCGCGSRGRTGNLPTIAEVLDAPKVEVELTIQDLGVSRGSTQQLRSFDRAEEVRLLGGRWQDQWVLADESVEPLVGDTDKILTAVASEEPNDDTDGDGVPDDDIVVTGTRPRTIDDDPWEPNPGDPGPGDGGGGGGGGDPPGEDLCSTLTAAQKAEKAIDAEAAKILNEILAQIDQKMEYASIIWRDVAGILHHTPLIPTSDRPGRFDLSALPQNSDGSPDYSGVVGFIHSHPEWVADGAGGHIYMYRPYDPGYLLYPSNTYTLDGVTQGDWLVWDSLIQQILFDGGNVSNFRQYIAGFDGDNLVLKEYNAADAGTTDPANGENVDPNTQACP
jgi:hypothetical protein